MCCAKPETPPLADHRRAGDRAPQRRALAEARQHAARLLAHRGRPRAGQLRADRPRAFTAELASQLPLGHRAGRPATASSTAPPLPEPVYVDRDMWEKIVLNLVSNAFKFTFAGEIAVETRIRRRTERARSRCATPAPAFPPTRCRNCSSASTASKARAAASIEGSGIGLALVQELVKLHGGAIRVESEAGAGTAFTVSLPFGTGHLPDQNEWRADRAPSTAPIAPRPMSRRRCAGCRRAPRTPPSSAGVRAEDTGERGGLAARAADACCSPTTTPTCATMSRRLLARPASAVEVGDRRRSARWPPPARAPGSGAVRRHDAEARRLRPVARAARRRDLATSR